MLVCTAAIISHLRSRNGPQARMVVEFLVEFPKLVLEPALESRKGCVAPPSIPTSENFL